MNKKILILCTGNSCRSQMAEGLLKSFDENLEVFSAGTNPSNQVHPKAVIVMKELGIDLSKNYPKKIDQFLSDAFDYVITVCDNAKETCPVFLGKVKNQLHIGFEDPAEATGTDEEVLNEFRRIRDEIKKDFYEFYKNQIANKNQLDIKILGTGCANCLKLEELVKEVVVGNNLAADIEKVTNKDKFMDYGVMLTPGLVVNGKVLSSGKIPTKSTLEHWLNDIINK
jgi:arsenate reductase